MIQPGEQRPIPQDDSTLLTNFNERALLRLGREKGDGEVQPFDLDQLTSWYAGQVGYSLGPDAAALSAAKLAENAREILEAHEAPNPEKAFLLSYYRYNRDTLGPLVATWSVAALKTHEQIRDQVDPNAALWWFARDGYPVQNAGRYIAPALGLDGNAGIVVHPNRNNLGIKDEVDPGNGEIIRRSPESLKMVKHYLDQCAGNAKVIVGVDSLPYAYMIQLMMQGKRSFISRAGNVGAMWNSDELPEDVANGFLGDRRLLPISLYSHICGGDWGDEVPASLIHLCEQAGIPLTADNRFALEAFADWMEATIKPHGSVTSFRHDGRSIVPDIPMNMDPLANKFATAAYMGISESAIGAAHIINDHGLEGFNYASAEHVTDLLAEFRKAQAGQPSRVIAAATPALTKRQQLFADVQQNPNWLGVQDLTPYVYKPQF